MEPSNTVPEPLEPLLLPETGYLRSKQVLKFIPVSLSRWYSGIQTGEFPQPVKLGSRLTMWRAEDIRALIHKLNIQ